LVPSLDVGLQGDPKDFPILKFVHNLVNEC
jgi:hypothetical protein